MVSKILRIDLAFLAAWLEEQRRNDVCDVVLSSREKSLIRTMMAGLGQIPDVESPSRFVLGALIDEILGPGSAQELIRQNKECISRGTTGMWEHTLFSVSVVGECDFTIIFRLLPLLSKNEDSELDFEEFEPGQRRRFEDVGKFVRVLISHRLSAKGVFPEQWSSWTLWGHASSVEKGRADHDWACKNGPWKSLPT